MENKEFPNIVSVSLSAWRADSTIHTQTDLFKFWDADKVAQIYTKSDLPNTDVCKKFFQISENAVIKSVFNRKKVVFHNADGIFSFIFSKRKVLQVSRIRDIIHYNT